LERKIINLEVEIFTEPFLIQSHWNWTGNQCFDGISAYQTPGAYVATAAPSASSRQALGCPSSEARRFFHPRGQLSHDGEVTPAFYWPLIIDH